MTNPTTRFSDETNEHVCFPHLAYRQHPDEHYVCTQCKEQYDAQEVLWLAENAVDQEYAA
jgi:hypothetical protein